jgi:hypothetical protein
MLAFYIMYDARGPYTNVLDLYLIPSMSHRHSALLRLYNNTEANTEQIWKTIETVWKDTSSSEVARAFVLAYRIMRLIIEEDGNNSWLAHGTPHCDVRQDYVNTPTGIKPKHTKQAEL